MKNSKKFRFTESSANTDHDLKFLEKLDEYFINSVGTNIEKINNFTKYVPRQKLAYFLAKYEIFKKILDVQGSIVECGVLFGGGLMEFAQLSAIFEPVNHQRKIIGFDTFAGFTKMTKGDRNSSSEFAKKGGYAVDSYDDLRNCIELYDLNRPIGHIPKVELIRGDATRTIPKYIHDNPQTVVSLLFLDFDIYEPTKVALKHFVPRMPKGSVIAFDEINAKTFPGETQAVLDTIGIQNLRIKRHTFNTYLSYAVLE